MSKIKAINSRGPYIPVRITTLRPGDKLDFNLYLLQDDTLPHKYILYLGRNVPYQSKEGVGTLYIRRCDEYLYWEYMKKVRRVVNKTPRLLKPVRNIFDTKKTTIVQESPYKQALVKTLLVDHPMDFELYRQDKWNYNKYTLYKNEDGTFGSEHLELLKRDNVECLFIPKFQGDAYWEYLVDNLAEILSPDTLNADEKVNFIYDVCLEAANRLFTKPVSGQFISRIRLLLEIVVRQITYHHEFQRLVGKFSEQYTLYSHSANVCIIGIALAKTLGISNTEELTSIAQGLLLHDIGKRLISKKILNKKGMLSSKELAEIRRHPIYGSELLRHHKQVDEVAMDIILHHHEKLDGYGYPHNLIGSQISTAARIAAIADVFDAMTTQRFYQEPYRGYTALKIMQEDMTKELDKSLLEILVRLFSPKHAKSTLRMEQPVEN